LPEATYKNNAIKTPRMMYPEGLLYFKLEIKIKYIHKNILATIKTKTSDINPKVKIFRLSKNVNELCVIGWKNKTIRSTKLIMK
jgi:hypothetical protein